MRFRSPPSSHLQVCLGIVRLLAHAICEPAWDPQYPGRIGNRDELTLRGSRRHVGWYEPHDLACVSLSKSGGKHVSSLVIGSQDCSELFSPCFLHSLSFSFSVRSYRFKIVSITCS